MSYVKAIKNKEGKRGNSCTLNFFFLSFVKLFPSLYIKETKNLSIPGKVI